MSDINQPTLSDVVAKLDLFSNNFDKLSTNVAKLSTDVERLSTDVERLSTDVERLSTDVERLSTDVEKSNDRFSNYQQATQWVVQLAFTLIASATITIIITSVFK